jgi:hypothetical protein
LHGFSRFNEAKSQFILKEISGSLLSIINKNYTNRLDRQRERANSRIERKNTMEIRAGRRTFLAERPGKTPLASGLEAMHVYWPIRLLSWVSLLQVWFFGRYLNQRWELGTKKS